MLETPPAEPVETWPPTMTPERADYIRRALLAMSTALLDSLISDLMAARSTGLPMSERLIFSTLQPLLPRLRALFLGKLSEADPASLERLMGAVSTTIEQVVAEAPGEPIDRWRFVWLPGVAAPELVPDTWTGRRG